MIEWLDKLPLLLMGPIVRRVEPNLVAVWVATREECTVELQLYTGMVASTSARALFTGATPRFTPTRAPTLRVGAKLHVACVVATDVTLVPETIYSYNLAFDAPDGRHDLGSLGLLADHAADEPPNLPLGYADGFLPSFTLPPSSIEHLVIAHGSCRRPYAAGPDALAFLDDLVRTRRNDPQARPHQLFLTGDQIYADDVARPMLALCTTLGHYLIAGVLPQPPAGSDPLEPGRYAATDALEHVPTRYAGDVAATHDNLTSAWRRGLCEIEGKLTTIDYESHLLSIGEFCAMYLLTHSPAVWPRGEPATPPTDENPSPYYPHRASVIVAPTASVLTSGGSGQAPVVAPSAKDLADQLATYNEHLPALEEVRKALPRIRRALANVPTYMILDDHEVTDDWNITARWVADVNGAPLGRAVLRNGLVAYALFQAWGSDPRYFAADHPGGSVLAQIRRLFPAGASKPPAAAAVTELDRLFGLAGGPSQVRWDWTYDGPCHRVLAIDARTRRAFTGPDDYPIIVPPVELERQIPEGPLPAGMEVLIVLAPSPTVSMPLVDDFVQATVVRVLDVVYEARDRKKGRPGYLDKDFESWFVDPPTLDHLLRRLATYPRVVVLSGDVHHASSSELSFWRRGHGEPSRLASFTASGLKNHAPGFIDGTVKIAALSEQAWHVFTPFERLTWDQDFPRPIEVPAEDAVPRALRCKLRRAPVIVPALGWPPGSTLHREPDAAFRLKVVRDQRPIDQLPPAAQTHALTEDIAPEVGIQGFSVIAQRHQRALATEALTRAAVFAHNLGVVTFSREIVEAPPVTSGDLTTVATRECLIAQQTFFTLHPYAQPPDAADAYTVHRVVLEPFPHEERPAIHPPEPVP